MAVPLSTCDKTHLYETADTLTNVSCLLSPRKGEHPDNLKYVTKVLVSFKNEMNGDTHFCSSDRLYFFSQF